jgi:hypothetical protein
MLARGKANADLIAGIRAVLLRGEQFVRHSLKGGFEPPK